MTPGTHDHAAAIAVAMSWVGRSHAEMDCEQLIVEYHRLIGVHLTGLYAGLFKGLFRTVFDPEPGDVVPICNHRLGLVRGVELHAFMTHGGVYCGDGRVLHSFEDSGVVNLPLTREPWFSRIARDKDGRRGYLRLRLRTLT